MEDRKTRKVDPADALKITGGYEAAQEAHMQSIARNEMNPDSRKLADYEDELARQMGKKKR